MCVCSRTPSAVMTVAGSHAGNELVLSEAEALWTAGPDNPQTQEAQAVLSTAPPSPPGPGRGLQPQA